MYSDRKSTAYIVKSFRGSDMKLSTSLIGKLLATTTVWTLCLPLGNQANAIDLKSDELRGESSKLPVDVLQNRFFLKSWRPEIGLLVGSMLNEAYTETDIAGFRGGLFFNEWIGAEVQYFRTTVKDSDDRKALNKKKYRDLEKDIEVTPDPETNPIHSAIDINAIVAPFYGKMNLLNKYIIYSDLYLSGGLSRVNTDQGDINALLVGVGQRFYIGKSTSVRVDFRNHIYNESRGNERSRKNALSIDFGVGYFFR